MIVGPFHVGFVEMYSRTPPGTWTDRAATCYVPQWERLKKV